MAFFSPEVGRKVEPLRRVVLIGHRALHRLPESSLKFHGDTGHFPERCPDNWKENNEVSTFMQKVFLCGTLKWPYLSKARWGSQEVTNQKIKLKSAGLVSLQSVLLSGTQCMRACVIMGSNLTSATN